MNTEFSAEFSEFSEASWPRLLDIARSEVRRYDCARRTQDLSAEYLASETLLRIHRFFGGRTPDESIKNLHDFLHRIVRNYLLDYLRHNRKRTANRVEIDGAAQPDSPETLTLRKCPPPSEVRVKTRVVERALAFAASFILGGLFRRRIETETARELVASTRGL